MCQLMTALPQPGSRDGSVRSEWLTLALQASAPSSLGRDFGGQNFNRYQIITSLQNMLTALQRQGRSRLFRLKCPREESALAPGTLILSVTGILSPPNNWIVLTY